MIDERSYVEILDSARGKFPSSSFLKKCSEFYTKNRFLSQKQIDSLDKLPVSGKLAGFYSAPKTWEDIAVDLVSSGVATEHEIESGMYDDIIAQSVEEGEDMENETWESYKESGEIRPH